jgi:hypothetical protein
MATPIPRLGSQTRQYSLRSGNSVSDWLRTRDNRTTTVRTGRLCSPRGAFSQPRVVELRAHPSQSGLFSRGVSPLGTPTILVLPLVRRSGATSWSIGRPVSGHERTQPQSTKADGDGRRHRDNLPRRVPWHLDAEPFVRRARLLVSPLKAKLLSSPVSLCED